MATDASVTAGETCCLLTSSPPYGGRATGVVFPGDKFPTFGKIALYPPGTSLPYPLVVQITAGLEAPDPFAVDSYVRR